MNPYKYRVNCDVCGGPGMTTAYGAGFTSHVDPRVCADHLAEKRERADAEAARNRWAVPA